MAPTWIRLVSATFFIQLLKYQIMIKLLEFYLNTTSISMSNKNDALQKEDNSENIKFF